MKRHYILTPFGSAGDVHPFLWIGRGLRERGHTVTLVVAPPFDRAARRAGLPFVTVGEPGDYERIIRNPDLWHPGPRPEAHARIRRPGDRGILRGHPRHGGADRRRGGAGRLPPRPRRARGAGETRPAPGHGPPATGGVHEPVRHAGDAGAPGMVRPAAPLAETGVLGPAEPARPGGRTGGARRLCPRRSRATAQPDAGVDAFARRGVGAVSRVVRPAAARLAAALPARRVSAVRSGRRAGPDARAGAISGGRAAARAVHPGQRHGARARVFFDGAGGVRPSGRCAPFSRPGTATSCRRSCRRRCWRWTTRRSAGCCPGSPSSCITAESARWRRRWRRGCRSS